MQWTDEAIVLATKKQGETSAVAWVLAEKHGVAAGIVRGAQSKAHRGILQPGNVVSVTWNARLPEHLGNFKAELLAPHASAIMQDATRLTGLVAACALIQRALPERHPYPKFYAQFYEFLELLSFPLRLDGGGLGRGWLEKYVQLELALLAESGFGLDLSACAATGSREDLIYVSPKSGRAVSRQAGEPYKEKLLALPKFLLSPPPIGGRVREGENIRTPNRYGSHSLIPNARELHTNMPEAETQLWYHLRAHRLNGYGFRRQHPMSERYIADFICLDKKLIIELDGGQHSEQQEYDAKRTQFLENEGYRVLRFWNNEVFENMEGVLATIINELGATPSPAPPPFRGRGEETLAGLRLTGYFLETWLLAPHNRKLPAARGRLIGTIENSVKSTEMIDSI